MRAFIPAFGAAIIVAASLSGCGDSSSKAAAEGTSNAREVAVKLTDAGCEPSELEIPSGATTFKVSNDAADAVTEFEVIKGDRILGEVENIVPGFSGDFALTLQPGTYELYCPNGDSAERGTLTVTD